MSLSLPKAWTARTVERVHVTPKGAYTGKCNGEILLYDWKTGDERTRWYISGPYTLISFASSPNGDVLIAGIRDCIMRFDPLNLQPAWTVRVGRGATDSTVLYQSDRVVYAAGGGELRRVDINGKGPGQTFKYSTTYLGAVALAVENVTTIYIGFENHIVAVKDCGTSWQKIGGQDFAATEGVCRSVLARDPDSVYFSTSRSVQRWDLNLKKLQFQLNLTNSTSPIGLAMDDEKNYLFAATSGVAYRLSTISLNIERQVILPGYMTEDSVETAATEIVVANKDVFIGCCGCIYQFDFELRMTGQFIGNDYGAHISSLSAVPGAILLYSQSAREAETLALKIREEAVGPGPWMKQYRSRLGSKRLRNIAIPGTHDSGTYSITSDSSVGQDCDGLVWAALSLVPSSLFDNVVGWTRTTSLNFTDQLNLGIRYFDLRTQKGSTGLRFVHKLGGAEVKELTTQLRDWLKAPGNDLEIVLLDFNHFYGMTDKDHAELVKLLQTDLGSLIVQKPLNEHSTLQDIWKAKGRVYIFYCSDATCALYPNILFPREKGGTSVVKGGWSNSMIKAEVLDNADKLAKDVWNKFKVTELVRTPGSTWGNLVSSYATSVVQYRSAAARNEESLLTLAADMAGDVIDRLKQWKANPALFMVNIVMVDYFNAYPASLVPGDSNPIVNAIIKFNL